MRAESNEAIWIMDCFPKVRAGEGPTRAIGAKGAYISHILVDITRFRTRDNYCFPF